MRTNGTEQGSLAAQPVVIAVAQDAASAELPAGSPLFTADYVRQGEDLVLNEEGGASLLVQGYFGVSTPPDLVMPSGAKISGELAVRLAGANAPAQFAQVTTPEGEEPVGEVTEISGSARVTRTNGVEQELSLGDPIFLGDVLQTGPDASVGIRFVDDTLFSLSSNGRLVIDQLIYNPEGADNALSLSLVQGAFAFVSGKIAPGDGPGMTIDTPVATIGVRGTTGAGQFLASLQSLIVSLLEGLDGELGVIDVFNEVSLQTLSSVLDTIVVTSSTEPLPPPSEASEAQLAIYNLALASLSRSFLDLIQDIEPEAGPEQEGGSGSSSGAILAQFIAQAELTAEFLAADESGEVQEFQVDVEEDELADLLAEDPNLILLLQTLAELELVGLTSVVDLDDDNSSEPVLEGGTGGSTGFEVLFIVGSAPVPVVADDIDIVSLSGFLEGATVSLTAPVDLDVESLSLSGALPDGIALDPSSTAASLVFTGVASTEAYEQALQLVRYDNTAEDPSDRTITINVDDGVGPSNKAVTTIGFAHETLVVGSSADDQPGSLTPHAVPDPFGDAAGAIVSEGADDVLIGDTGGNRPTTVNLVVAVDISGSMGGRLPLMQSALQNLLSGYNAFAAQGVAVMVQMFAFANFEIGSPHSVGGVPIETEGAFDLSTANGFDDAIAFINQLQTAGATNYQSALDQIRLILGANAPADLNTVYFLSDGTPTVGDTDGAINDLLAFVDDYTTPGGSFDPAADLDVHSVGIDIDAEALAVLSQFDTTNGAENVVQAEDLEPEPINIVRPLSVGSDILVGNAGDDVIFGDVINTDGLASEAFGPAGQHDGAGYEALIAHLTDNALAGTAAGEAPSADQVRQFILDDPFAFIVAGDTRGEADSLDGGAGDDILFGMGGADLLRGGRDDDLLFGGSDQDTFLFSLTEASGNDVIPDFLAGPQGDTINLTDVFDYSGDGLANVADLDSALAAADGWSVQDDGTDVVITLGNNPANGQNGGQITIEAIGDGTLDSFAALDGAINLEVSA